MNSSAVINQVIKVFNVK